MLVDYDFVDYEWSFFQLLLNESLDYSSVWCNIYFLDSWNVHFYESAAFVWLRVY